MKRNSLLAKSLTLGLAVATAAASMSTPGGLMAPVTVQAEEGGSAATQDQVDLTADNISKYFQLDPIAILSDGSATADIVKVKGEEATGKVTVLYQKGEETATDTQPSETGAYNVLIKVAGGTELNSTDAGVALGTIKVYAALSEELTITYKVGEQDTTAETVQKSAVTISAESYTVGTDEDGLTESYDFTSNQTGESSKNILFKKDETVSAKKIRLKFDVDEPVISNVEVTNIGDKAATVTVTATDKTVGESSNLTYKLTQNTPSEESATPVESANGEFSLSELTPNTEYSYTLTVTDEAGNETTYNDTITFTTEKSNCSTHSPSVGTFDTETRKMTFTVEADKASKDYDYSLDGGNSWTNGNAEGSILTIEGTTVTLQIDNNAYEGSKIQLRVAETATEKAGDGVAYTSAIDEKDVTAPVLSPIEAPQSNDITDSSAKIFIRSNEKGRAYYVVKETQASDITAEDIKKDGQNEEVDNLEADTSKEITISDKASKTTYYVYVVAEDAAGNLSDVQSVTFTTKKAAFVGTLAIKTGETGGSELGATLEIGTTLTATVTGGNETQASHYTYQWYRTKDDQTNSITNATENTYSVTKDDLGATIFVEIIAADESFETEKSSETPAVEKIANTITLNAGDVFKNEPELVDGVKSLTVTVPENVTSASRKLEYQIGTGEWVTLPDTNKIPLENKAYAANTIKVRVQATDEIKESDAVSYDQKITATLEGSVTLSTETQVGQTITATVTGAQQDAVLQYQFVRVTTGENGAETSENIGSASETSTYPLTVADIGKKIKVEVTASGEDYTGTITSENTAEITKADGRTITVEQVKSEISNPAAGTETYTYTMKTVDGAKYQMTAGANTAAVEENWKDEKEFANLTPGQSYTFHAMMPATDEYNAGTPISFTIDFPKLTHTPLQLDYSISGKQVTITQPASETDKANVEYTFDGTKWVNDNVNTYEEGATTVTIGIRYKDSDIYNPVTAITETIDLNKSEVQTAPNKAAVAVKTNEAKTKYQLTITDPTELGGAPVEYSLNGTDYTTKAEIEKMEFAATETINLYVRKAATETANASKAVITTAQMPVASAAPTISSTDNATTFTGSLDVKLTADEGVTIYYTTNGTDPTVNTETSATTTKTITISATTTIKAIAVENGKVISSVVSQKFTKESTPVQPVTPPSYDSSSNSGSTTPTTPTTQKPAESKPVTETKTETTADGTKVTTTETKAADGSVEKTVELKNDETGVKATVEVAKDADGKVTEASAAVTQTTSDKKATISASVVAQIAEAAGTKDVEITTKIVDEKGKTVCKVTVNAADLKAGKQMKVLKINSKTGELSLVNKSTYKVDKNGNLAMNDLKKASYMVLTKSEADAFSKQVLNTVKVATAKKSVTAGKNTKISLDKKLDMNNVAKITYSTSKKSVATVNKNGTITTKKAGKVTVNAKVTLKNGKTKTVKMTITVKKAN